MKQRLLMIFPLFLCSFCWAQRVIPADMHILHLQKVQFPIAEFTDYSGSWLGHLLRKKIVGQIDDDVRIRNQQNRFVVRSKLLSYLKNPVAVHYDANGVITEIWILTDEEASSYSHRIAAE